MPKIELDSQALWSSLGKKPDLLDFEKKLEIAKAELDGLDEETHKIKIEFNDTNRPDLWSRMGLVRTLKSYYEDEHKSYSFFSTKTSPLKDEGREIFVKEGLEFIRPYITGFVAKGKTIDSLLLEELIQTQEKLTSNFGQKRRRIAMGIYQSQALNYPLSYEAVSPKETSFTPLGEENIFTLEEILKKTPKGKEFAHLLEGFNKHPILKDAKGEILSYPPILNSEALGVVKEGDSEIFVELTGLNLESLWLATNVVACDLSDLGFEILPVKITYSSGISYTTPLYFQEKMSFKKKDLFNMVGQEFSKGEIENSLLKMDITQLEWVNDEEGIIFPPAYRNDFMHARDVIEDIIIGYGLNEISPSHDLDNTQGSLSPIESLSRRVRNLMVGMGFQEMLYNYLGSKVEFIKNMRLNEDDFIIISNPMTENYEVVRNSILPNLLKSESVSAHAVYPHSIFEIGKTVSRLSAKDSLTSNKMGFLYAGEEATFSKIYAQISAFFYYFNLEWSLEEKEDNRFILGRVANIKVQDSFLGVMGEVHPEVLENFGITAPCVSCEIDLDSVLNLLYKK